MPPRSYSTQRNRQGADASCKTFNPQPSAMRPRLQAIRNETHMLCVIFDLDGTLIDSEPLSNQAFLDLLPDLDDTVCGLMHRYSGMHLAHVFEDLSRRLDKSLPAEFEDKYRARVEHLYDTALAPIPGAVEMLSAIQNPPCVASNGPAEKVQHGLRVAGLAAHFGKDIYSAHDVGHWKPEPQLFLHAARSMGYEPKNCIVLEDSETGLQAAKSAGMRTVHFSPAGRIHEGLATAQIDDLLQFPGILEHLTRFQ